MAAIRQQINIAAPIRAVWNALTTKDGLEAWWADEARVDATVGGRLVITVDDAEGQPIEERGLFHKLRPTREIEIAWDSTSPAPTKGTRILFQVARDRDETRLRVVHSGGGVLNDEESREDLDKWWRRQLKMLRRDLEG